MSQIASSSTTTGWNHATPKPLARDLADLRVDAKGAPWVRSGG